MVSVNRRPKKTLTTNKVNGNLKAGKYFDGYGLFLRVYDDGSRRWYQRLTINGKRSEIGLGSPPSRTLADVREEAFENYRLVRKGGDPLRERRTKEAIPTFKKAAEEYHEKLRDSFTSDTHSKQWLASIQRHVFPVIGNVRVTDITPQDILKIIEPIWTTKRETAERIRQRMGAIFTWVIALEHRKDDPTAAIIEALPKAEKKVRQRKALPYQKVNDCLLMIQDTNANLSTKLALEFLILTAARSGEVRGALWTEIDLTNKVWEIPAERMKMKRPHRVPLCDRAIEILNLAASFNEHGKYVFPGSKKDKPIADVTLSKLIKENGYNVDVHGFRTTFRTWAQERTSFPREVAEMAIAHVVGNKVEQAYARSDLFEQRIKMMKLWADFVAMPSFKEGGVDNVRPIKATA